MSAVTKNLHVHFDDDLPATPKTEATVVHLDQNENTCNVFKYTRNQLLDLKKNIDKEPISFLNDLHAADEKRKEKIKCVLKKEKYSKIFNSKTITQNGTVIPNGDVAEKNAVHSANDIDRSNFRQMIEAAVSNAQQHNAGYTAKDNRRQRYGSGRIPDKFAMQDSHPVGIDVRYMNNELLRDMKETKGGRSRRDDNMPFNWNKGKMYETASHDTDNMDAKSDEPEWANCGPISKNDIIELHGFDGPIDDDKQSESSAKGDKATDTLLARSTPSKSKPGANGKLDEYFNFEEFLKLDLPQAANGTRDNETGESRFTQFFGRNNSPNRSKMNGNGFYDVKGKANNTPAQFFNWQQKANMKKIQTIANLAHASKFRSVEELEAKLCPNQPKPGPVKPSTDTNNFQAMFNRANAQPVPQKTNQFNPAQVNFLLNLINRSAEELYHQRLSKSAALQRPDAQLLIHRLVNGEITQFHILQQINTPAIHQRDRETLVAVLNFCNENQQWLLQQQQQQLKQKERIQFQLRQLQLLQLQSGRFMGMAQQFDSQNVRSQMNQIPALTKPFNDQRKSYNPRSAPHTKWNSNKMGNNSMGGSFYFQSNQKFQSGQQKPQNGLQFIQSQMNQPHGRQNQFNASAPSNVFGENTANVDYVANIVNK